MSRRKRSRAKSRPVERRHNENSDGAGVAMESETVAYATLFYYMVSEMPGTLGNC